MKVRDLCELFDGLWSDLEVRIFVDGTEVVYDGGPEEKPNSDDVPPDHYELYLRTPAPERRGHVPEPGADRFSADAVTSPS